MKSIEIKRYQPALKKQWDDFIKKSQTDCLLFYRDFMDYHADRFQDYSLIFEDEKGWLAVFPAHFSKNCLKSHDGLTFGGFITRKRCRWKDYTAVFEVLLQYAIQQQFKAVFYKCLPFFYQLNYGGEIAFLLFQTGAKLMRRDLNYLIDLRIPLTLNKTKTQIYRKDFSNRLRVVEESDFHFFWTQLLEPSLQERYAATPIHSVEEIQNLKNLFPFQIKLFTLYLEEEMMAGIVMFENLKVVKSQYAAVNEKGRKNAALDQLYVYLIKKYQKEEYYFFDLGHVNKASGTKINASLAQYKEGLGASPYNLDTYMINLQ